MTRKDTSKVLVAVTGVLIISAAALVAVVDRAPPGASADSRAPEAERGAGVDTPTRNADTVRVARGRQVFRSEGCTGCHAAEGVGPSRLPLDGVGSRLPADVLRAWIVDPRSVDPSVRKPAYDDLPEADVDALVAYMQSLTEEDPEDG